MISQIPINNQITIPAAVMVQQIVALHPTEDGHAWIETVNGSIFCVESYEELLEKLRAM